MAPVILFIAIAAAIVSGAAISTILVVAAVLWARKKAWMPSTIPITTDNWRHTKSRYGQINKDGILAIAGEKKYPEDCGCPFGDDSSGCGAWCPQFQRDGDTVYLCMGRVIHFDKLVVV